MTSGTPQERPRRPNVDGYRSYLDDANRREIANAEAYDKALLTLSSAFLALSMTFGNNVVPFGLARCLWALLGSWSLFTATIMITIGSFMYQRTVSEELKVGAWQYFIEKDVTLTELEELDKRNKELKTKLDRLNGSAGVAFILAVVLFTGFVWVNVTNGGSTVTENRAEGIDKEAVRTPSERRGIPVTTFQEFDVPAEPLAAPPAAPPQQPRPAAESPQTDQPKE